MEITIVFSLFQKRRFRKHINSRGKKDTFWTSCWAPRDVKNSVNPCHVLIILLLQKDDILEPFRGPPKITKIEKGLPVKDVEQKLRNLVIFRVVPKSEY